MITIAGIDFDYQDYDERGDVLFLTGAVAASQSPRRLPESCHIVIVQCHNGLFSRCG